MIANETTRHQCLFENTELIFGKLKILKQFLYILNFQE